MVVERVELLVVDILYHHGGLQQKDTKHEKTNVLTI
jgi:hypothetical protein